MSVVIVNPKIKEMQFRALNDEVYKQGLLDAIYIAVDHVSTYKDNRAACVGHIIEELQEVAGAKNEQT